MKKKLRQQVRAVLERMTAADRADKSGRAQRSLTALPEFARARSVMIYLPMVEEARTDEIAQAAWAAGKRVLAPRVDLPTRSMDALEIYSLTRDLSPGPYDILQPTRGEPCPPGQIDLIVVPALAFCRNGGRLGRGAGFYDRFLLQARKMDGPVACGLAFDEQLIPEVPMFDHDQWLDMLVTDREVLRFNSPVPGRSPGSGDR